MRTSILSLGVLSLTLLAVHSARADGAHGGDIIADPPPSDILIETAIKRAKQMLPLIFNFHESDYKNYPNQQRDQGHYEVKTMAMLFNHPFDQDVFAVLAKTTFVPYAGDCIDEDGQHKDGATGYLGADKVCFSLPRIRERTTELDVFRKVLVLASHEMAHRMGADEQAAEHFGTLNNGMLALTNIFDFEQWARFEFFNQVSTIHAFSENMIAKLEVMFKTKKQFSKRAVDEFCRQYSDMARRLPRADNVDQDHGRLGMSPLRANMAKVSNLLDEKKDLDLHFCEPTDDTSELYKWYLGKKVVTSDEFAAARQLPDNMDAPGLFRRPDYGDLVGLYEELIDVSALSNQILKSRN